MRALKGGNEKHSPMIISGHFFNSLTVFYHLWTVEEASLLATGSDRRSSCPPCSSPPFLHLHVVCLCWLRPATTECSVWRAWLGWRGMSGPETPGTCCMCFPTRERWSMRGRAYGLESVSSVKSCASFRGPSQCSLLQCGFCSRLCFPLSCEWENSKGCCNSLHCHVTLLNYLLEVHLCLVLNDVQVSFIVVRVDNLGLNMDSVLLSWKLQLPVWNCKLLVWAFHWVELLWHHGILEYPFCQPPEVNCDVTFCGREEERWSSKLVVKLIRYISNTLTAFYT